MLTLRSNQDTTNSPNFFLEGPAIICTKLPFITIPKPTTSVFCRKWTAQYTLSHIAGDFPNSMNINIKDNKIKKIPDMNINIKDNKTKNTWQVRRFMISTIFL